MSDIKESVYEALCSLEHDEFYAMSNLRECCMMSMDFIERIYDERPENLEKVLKILNQHLIDFLKKEEKKHNDTRHKCD